MTKVIFGLFFVKTTLNVDSMFIFDFQFPQVPESFYNIIITLDGERPLYWKTNDNSLMKFNTQMVNYDADKI